MLPGLMRTLSAPASMHSSARLIVKVDVHHQRAWSICSLMAPTALGRRHVRHSHSNDLAPRRRQAARSGPRSPLRRWWGCSSWIGWSQERRRPTGTPPDIKSVSSCLHVTKLPNIAEGHHDHQQKQAGQSPPHGSRPHTSGSSPPPGEQLPHLRPRSAGRCCPPSRAGRGRRFIMARFTAMRAMSIAHVLHPGGHTAALALPPGPG